MTKEDLASIMDDLDRRVELLSLSKEQLVHIIRYREEQLKDIKRISTSGPICFNGLVEAIKEIIDK